MLQRNTPEPLELPLREQFPLDCLGNAADQFLRRDVDYRLTALGELVLVLLAAGQGSGRSGGGGGWPTDPIAGATLPHPGRGPRRRRSDPPDAAARSHKRRRRVSRAPGPGRPPAAGGLEPREALRGPDHPVHATYPRFRLARRGGPERPHPQEVARERRQHPPRTAGHVVLHLQLVIRCPAAAPLLQPRAFLVQYLAVRALVDDRVRVLRGIGPEGFQFRIPPRQTPERIDDDGKERIPVGILGPLPLQLGADVRLAHVAVGVRTDVEGVAVVPPHELLPTGCL